jgi:hypothetical protein
MTEKKNNNIVAPKNGLSQEWDIPPEWNISEKGKEGIRIAVSVANTRHGLYATVPIVCKGSKCPYKNTCSLYMIEMAPQGERCPIEIAQVMKIYNDYVTELEIDETSRVDLSMIKELIDIEITAMRTDKILAEEATFIEMVPFAVTERGEILTKPEINKAQLLRDGLIKRRHEILKSLNATRKDKASKESGYVDPSTYAAELLKRKAMIVASETKSVETEYTIIEDKSNFIQGDE